MVEGFAGKMNAKDVDVLAEDARQFVRKSPAVAIVAAAAIGFVLARLVRSGGKDSGLVTQAALQNAANVR